MGVSSCMYNGWAKARFCDLRLNWYSHAMEANEHGLKILFYQNGIYSQTSCLMYKSLL